MAASAANATSAFGKHGGGCERRLLAQSRRKETRR
jgi:hypothetical protein